MESLKSKFYNELDLKLSFNLTNRMDNKLANSFLLAHAQLQPIPQLSLQLHEQALVLHLFESLKSSLEV